MRRRAEVEDAAAAADRSKQRGFYVDQDDSGAIHSPSEVDVGGVDEALRLAVQVIEMLLVKDHVRMKRDAVTPYDSTHEMQFRLLPISHPEDWTAASGDHERRSELGAEERRDAQGAGGSDEGE